MDNYRTVGSLLIQENLIFTKALMFRIYEHLTGFMPHLHNWKINSELAHLLIILLISPQRSKAI